jgi:RNA polymerase sigma-70 factor (ECF subfamily)
MTFTPSTRASLLIRLRDPCDHDAWVEFVELYEPVIHRLLQRRGLQDADAREVMQDVFMAVGRGVDRWDPARERGTFRSWLRAVTRNLTINWLRRRDRSILATGGDEMQAMLEQIPDASAPESAEFDIELRRAQLRQAAESVEREVKPATWRAFWETAVVGATAADAAKTLGMNVGAVRVAKCRVFVRLRAVLADIENDQ